MAFSLFNPCEPCCDSIVCEDCTLRQTDVLWARMTACTVVSPHYDWNLILEYVADSGFWYGFVDFSDPIDNYFLGTRFHLKFYCESGSFKVKTKCHDNVETEVNTDSTVPVCSPFSFGFAYAGQFLNCNQYGNHEVLIRKPSDFTCLDGDVGCNTVPPNNLFFSSNLGDATLIRNGSVWDATIGNFIFRLRPDWNQSACGPSSILPNCLYTLSVYCGPDTFSSGSFPITFTKITPSGFSCDPVFFWNWVGSGDLLCGSAPENGVLTEVTIIE